MDSTTKHAGIDAYIAGLPDWQQTICTQLRELVHQAIPDAEETIKRSVIPFFVVNGRSVCALMKAKDHVNILLYDPTVADPTGIINQGHANKTAKAIQVKQHEFPDKAALAALLQNIAENNRRGGWRKLSASP